MRFRPWIAAIATATLVSACSAPELRTVRWQRADVTAEGIVTSYPADRCEALDHVEVDYGTLDLTMTVYLRPAPVACLGVRIINRVLVPLHEPLNGRAIRDGAA